jgi:hypothetical protein
METTEAKLAPLNVADPDEARGAVDGPSADFYQKLLNQNASAPLYPCVV